MPGGGQPRHAIKRADRLLANPHLQTGRPLFYLMMLRALLGSVKHPLVLVDWSPVDASGCFFLLRAAIPLAGRSFVIYERVHEREGCPKYQGQLLDALALMLPPPLCCAVLCRATSRLHAHAKPGGDHSYARSATVSTEL